MQRSVRRAGRGARRSWRPGRGFIARVADRYQADPELIDCDLWRFERALAAAQAAEDDTATKRALAEAVAAYTGDLAEASYYDWAEAAREDLRRRALDAAARLAELHERAGDNDAALGALEHAIGIDPYAEDLYRRTMRLQAACGRPDAVRRTYRYLETRLTELDVDPDPATQRLLADLATPAVHLGQQEAVELDARARRSRAMQAGRKEGHG